MSFLLPKNININSKGLTSAEAQKNIEKYGKNTLSRYKRTTFLKQFISAFGDPIIKILLIALVLNVVIAIKNSNIYEPLGIALALFSATFVSALSEHGSENAFLKLQAQYSNAEYKVMRDGNAVVLDICDITVGDVVMLGAGQKVPADGIVTSGQVFVDMSALTGESGEKQRKKTAQTGDWDILNQGQLFCGSVVTSGECEMIVGRVGDTTFYGGVAKEIQSEADASPLAKRLSALASLVGKIGYVAAALVFVADIFNALILDNNFNMSAVQDVITSPQIVTILLHALTLAITVVVVAVPEGLPMMITVVLSSNMSRLKRDNVLVKKLAGIETAGCINMLFCDKTGTLTTGRLSVAGVYDINANDITRNMTTDACLALLANNESSIASGRVVGGNATDRAILKRFGAYSATIKKRINFDSEKKYSAVLVGDTWYIKGAPELFLNQNLPAYKKWQELASEGVRVIAFAKAGGDADLTPLGIVAISDRVRPDAKRSVASVKSAGINVCMVTGDNLSTAISIAKASGILDKDSLAIDRMTLEKMSDAEVIKNITRIKVVARALPQDKSRLVRLCKLAGLVCAMTGDGINDAPALKSADVGFAMGSGTEVAKQAGDIVVLDDNFLSISKAILYGRTIFKSIRKFIVFQLTMNLCAVAVSLIGPFIGIDTPVTVIQMLWINMIMDTLAGLAFAGEAPLKSYMKERPLKKTEQVLSRSALVQTLFMGMYCLGVCILFLCSPTLKKAFGFYTNFDMYMTAFFALFVFLGLFAAICARVPSALNIFCSISKNKAFVIIFTIIACVQILIIYFGGSIFRTSFIEPIMLIRVIIIASTIVLAEFLRKLVFKKIK